jgi:hypothetical protein
MAFAASFPVGGENILYTLPICGGCPCNYRLKVLAVPKRIEWRAPVIIPTIQLKALFSTI